MAATPHPGKPRNGPSNQRAAPARVANEVRIIGGLWKRTKLPVADKPGLRPTPDRVRETLFNWLGHDLAGWRCIDAFAGTGALGFEAASRGADDVMLVEQDGELVDKLRALKARLEAGTVQVQRGNAVTVLQRLAPASMDLVFLDPPFEANLYDKLLPLAAPALSARGLVYLEAPHAWDDARLAAYGLSLQRHLKAGAVHAHLLRRSDNPRHEPESATPASTAGT
jgi:16S rRNA (guanine(966)-N(2))-methyltransferase RsmD